jgi:large subunit ribosomal protein L4
MKAAALRGALSDRARADRVHVIASFADGDTPSTKAAAAAIAAITGRRRVLVVLDRDDELSWKSLRNVRGVHLIDQGQLNTYDVLVNDDVVFTRAALDAFIARSGGTTRALPDLSTPDIPGAPVPSVAPAEGAGTVTTSPVVSDGESTVVSDDESTVVSDDESTVVSDDESTVVSDDEEADE